MSEVVLRSASQVILFLDGLDRKGIKEISTVDVFRKAESDGQNSLVVALACAFLETSKFIQKRSCACGAGDCQGLVVSLTESGRAKAAEMKRTVKEVMGIDLDEIGGLDGLPTSQSASPLRSGFGDPSLN
jgi:hypothetical protein